MAFAEFLAENFHSVANLTWDLLRGIAYANFSVENTAVRVRFEERPSAKAIWLVSFETHTPPAEREDYYRAFSILNGVFQAAEEFIGVREPDELVFATKRADLAHVYETYLHREQGRIEALGYRLLQAQRVELYTDYALQRIRPSRWSNT